MLNTGIPILKIRLKRQIDTAESFLQKIFRARKKMQSEGTETSFTTSLQWVLVTCPNISFVFFSADERSSKDLLLEVKSNTFQIPRLDAFLEAEVHCIILDLGLCHRGNQTRISANASGLSIHGMCTKIDGEPTEGLEDSPRHTE